MDRYTWQGTESSQQPSKELVPLDQYHQETESANNYANSEVAPSPVEPSDEIQTLASDFIAAF